MTTAGNSWWRQFWQAVFRFEQWVNGLQGRRKFYFFAVVLAICVPMYVYGGIQQLENINNRNYWVDQDAYINYAQRLHDTDYAYIGDFNRMPLYPFLVSKLYKDGLSEDQYFERAKMFNLALSVWLLIGLLLMFVYSFDPLPALNLWLLAAFMVYIFKSPYIQVELLFYTFFFAAFILMVKLLVRPSWLLAILTGAWIGVCHLTKNSMLPGLALLLIFMGIRVVAEFWRMRQIGSGPVPAQNMVIIPLEKGAHRVRHYKKIAYQIACIGLLVITFLGVIWPYINTAQRVFGHYFYNVNTTFYVWYDSWEEAEAGVRLHGDYYQWPDMPEDEIPSMQKYLRDHTPEQIARRFIYGFYVSLQRHTYSGGYGYFWYLIAYLIAAGVFIQRTWKGENRGALLEKMRKYWVLLLFLAAFFGGYLSLFAFYVEIHPGQRFMLTILLPALYCLTMLLHLPIFNALMVRVGGVQVQTVRFFNVVLFGALVIHSLLNVVHGAGIIHGGG